MQCEEIVFVFFFFQIMRYIHCFGSNNVDTYDEAWKLINLMEKLKTRRVEMFVPVQNPNYDESMIKYLGRHSCKQFIRGKPIRFGYKMLSLNLADGYLINFDTYQGKLPGGRPSYETIFGKCTAPLVYFIEKQPTEKRNLSYRIFCDNLFAVANLLSIFFNIVDILELGLLEKIDLAKIFLYPEKHIF